MNNSESQIFKSLQFNFVALDQIISSAIPDDDFEKKDAKLIIYSSIELIVEHLKIQSKLEVSK